MSMELQIQAAADAIRRGSIVVMPTETVYGLAADATNEAAVARIFAAKGRPATNPLIVHVGSFAQASALVSEIPDWARDLVSRFWPGPLTLVLNSAGVIPRSVAGGLDTIALRIPAHPVALRLIAAAERPVAAPSANPFTMLSPTQVEHLDPTIVAAAALVLDGGPCEVGIESTVVDATGAVPVVLRSGVISASDIAETTGLLVAAEKDSARSPGHYPRHYSPRAELRLVSRISAGVPGLTFGSPGSGQTQMPQDPLAYATRLYAALHKLDELNPEYIEVEVPPQSRAWEAVRDRLTRAAHP